MADGDGDFWRAFCPPGEEIGHSRAKIRDRGDGASGERMGALAVEIDAFRSRGGSGARVRAGQGAAWAAGDLRQSRMTQLRRPVVHLAVLQGGLAATPVCVQPRLGAGAAVLGLPACRPYYALLAAAALAGGRRRERVGTCSLAVRRVSPCVSAAIIL